MVVDDGPWTARIARARRLAVDHASAAEVLEFYARLVEFQERLVRGMSTRRFAAGPVSDPAPQALIASLDQARYRALVPKLLSWLQRAAPHPLAASAQRLLDDDPSDRQRMFEAYWAWAAGSGASPDETRAFVVEAVLQPFAESIVLTRGEAARDHAGAPREPGDASRCPACGGRPVVGMLREAGQGARRSVACGLCSTEWRVPRACCPSCGEARHDALATIRAENFPAAQLDACASCRVYVKTLDLTRDNTMVPIVDDLATLPLDLWAQEQGYTRLRPHLLRL